MFDPGNETQQELGAGDAVLIRLQPVKAAGQRSTMVVHGGGATLGPQHMAAELRLGPYSKMLRRPGVWLLRP